MLPVLEIDDYHLESSIYLDNKLRYMYIQFGCHHLEYSTTAHEVSDSF